MTEKRYISLYIDSKLADRLEKSDEETQEDILHEYILKKRVDIKEDLEILEEDVLHFKAVCATQRKALKEYYEDEQNRLYSMWEDSMKARDEAEQQAKQAARSLPPLYEATKELNDRLTYMRQQLSNLDVHASENILRLAETLSNMDEKSKYVLTFLVNNYGNDSDK